MLSFPQKLPGERVSAQIDFAARLPTGLTITDGSNSITIKSVGATDATLQLDGPVQRLGSIIGAALIGGTAKVDYILTFTVTLSDGQVLQEQGLVSVVDAFL